MSRESKEGEKGVQEKGIVIAEEAKGEEVEANIVGDLGVLLAVVGVGNRSEKVQYKERGEIVGKGEWSETRVEAMEERKMIRIRWFEAMGSQEWAKFGVGVNGKVRIIREDGRVECIG